MSCYTSKIVKYSSEKVELHNFFPLLSITKVGFFQVRGHDYFFSSFLLNGRTQVLLVINKHCFRSKHIGEIDRRSSKKKCWFDDERERDLLVGKEVDPGTTRVHDSRQS